MNTKTMKDTGRLVFLLSQAILLSGKPRAALLTALLCLMGCLSMAQSVLPSPVSTPDMRLLDKFSRYQRYTMEQGLSSNSVRTIVQDDDGFLWFGTEEGLNRFDGEHFTAFFSQPNGKGLPNDHITQMLVLPGHRLLVGTEKGLCVLYTRRLEIEPVVLPTRPESVAADLLIWALCLDSAQGRRQIWVGTDAGVHLLNDQLQVTQSYFRSFKPGEGVGNGFAQDFLTLPDGTVALKYRSPEPPYTVTWQTLDFQNQKLEPLAQRLPGCGALDTAWWPGNITTDGRNHIWYSSRVASPVALYQFDWATRNVRPLLLNNYGPADRNRGRFNRVCLLPDSFLLLQRYFGAPLLYNLRDGSTTDLPTWKTSAPDGKAIATFVDRDGNLWLCPRFEGIYFLTLKDLPATPMMALNAAHKKMMAQVGVSEEWFGFGGIEYAGQWVVGSGNGGLYTLPKTDAGMSGSILGNDFQTFAYPHSFAPDRGDTIWICGLDGPYWYNVANNTNGPLRAHIPGLDSLDNRFLYRDHHGLIWGRVRNNGVCCFDTRTRRLQHFPSQGEHAVFPMRSATGCSEGPDGDLWFCFGQEERYVVRWRRASGVFEKIEPRTPAGIQCTKAVDLLADKQGNLWLYSGSKWYVVDTRTLEVQPFGKNNGLVTNDPNGRCLDKMGNVWFATSYGLSRYDPRSRQLRTFYQTDGLLSNIISNVELIDTARNILFVSTDRGMCLFEPEKLGAAAPAPATHLTALWVSDSLVPLPESGFLGLSYTRNTLRIEFTGVNFINGPTNRYQYSMEPEGEVANWKEAGTDNFANFLNLSPGHYTFLARTANSDGEWGKETARLEIVIYPPWWLTWTFRLFLLVALALFGWWLYRRQIESVENREKEKARVRQQMADLEMKALRSQMNPHFVFNALNSVQNFILKNDTREASRYLTKFARLMRLILENSESPMVPLAREIELLRYYTELEQLRFNNRFSFDFQVDSSLQPEVVSIPGMLIQPHIENAIWHGLMHKTTPGHLWLRFKKADDKTLVCEIEDDGVGRIGAAEIEKDRHKSHRSTGLANIKTRLELLNAQLANDIRLDFEDLYDDAGQARGTKVVVRMPISG